MKKLNLLLFVAILLTACQPAATPQPTAIPPTVTAPTSSPVEALAGSTSDLIGVWWFTQARAMIEFKSDGTSRVFYGSDTFDEGSFTFDNGKVTWVTTSSCKDQLATYEVYLIKQNGESTWLRMQVVGGDPCHARADVLAGKAKLQNP